MVGVQRARDLSREAPDRAGPPPSPSATPSTSRRASPKTLRKNRCTTIMSPVSHPTRARARKPPRHGNLHSAPLSARDQASATFRMKYSWKRCSPVTSGWNEVPSRLPCSTATTRPSARLRERRRRGPDRLDDGAADEHRVHGRLAEFGDVEVGLERVDSGCRTRCGAPTTSSPPKRLLPRDRVEHGVGEHDEAGARAVHRHARGDRGPQRRLHAEGASELVDHARLAARDDEAVDLGELLGAPHERRPRRPGPSARARARGRRPGGRGRRRGAGEATAPASSDSVRSVVTSRARRGGAARRGRRR